MPDTAVSPADVRTFANLPSEVTDTMLQPHIEIATRDLMRRTGLTAAPAGQELEWSEAAITRALASAFPWLNTFALDGAAKVGRLEGSLQYRFLDADDVEARVADLTARFDTLVAQLVPTAPDDIPDVVATGSTFMFSI